MSKLILVALEALVLIIGVLAIGALMIWLSAPARAAVGRCGDYELFRAALFKTYKEVPQDMGMAGPAIIILFLSPVGSFTLVSRFGDGNACIIAAGTDWVQAPPQIKGKET